MKHTFLPLTIFIFSCINVFAYDFTAICETGQALAYTINEDLKTVCVYMNQNSNVSGELIIPADVEYDSKIYRVTSIGERAFYGCCNLTSVSIPIGVTSIGEKAFYYCGNLMSVTIPESVNTIGECAFGSKDEIDVYIYKSGPIVVYSGTAEGRPWGAKMVCGAKDENFCYENVEETIISKYIGKSTVVIIPNGVTTIGDGAFRDCSELASITIPNSVTTIGVGAFSSCSSLTSITIPNSVITIGVCAFRGCSGLTSITIPNSVITIGMEAFYNCSNLTSITIPNSVTTIGDGAFFSCSSLTSIMISNSVTSIGDAAFLNCFGLTSIMIPDSLDVSNAGLCFRKDNIGYKVLNGREVSVTEGFDYNKYIGGRYWSLTSRNKIYYTGDIILPNIVTIGNTYSVTSIGEWAFSGCSELTSITIPNSVTKIGGRAFSGCSGLTSIAIPNSVTSIGVSAFFGCSGLTSIAIPNSVTSIENAAFHNCSGLTSITIPNGVTTIGEGAFSGCTLLKDVTCLATVPPTAYANSFENYNGYLTIPCDNFEAYDIHAVWGTFKHVECLGAETVELTKDEVAVVPEKNEAVFSMPKNENANTYTLTIQNNGVTFCTLTFNAQGQLANIDFSTTKSYELKSDVAGFQFTVTGLSTASDYGYSFKALASNKSVLKEYAGSFTTKNADGTGGSVQGGGEGTLAVEAVSNATAVTIVNRQILVNGEAPAFVVTVSGKKIANKNLKSGVYFVVVDGETVKVVVN